MSFFQPQNPGIGGLDELTPAEEIFLTSFAGLPYQDGDVIYYNGSGLQRLAKSTDGKVLGLSSGLPAWVDPTAASDTFETFNKNLKAYDFTINYSGDDINTIVYDLTGGLSVTKTFNYTSGDLTSVVLTGDHGLSVTTKTLTYDVNGNIDTVSYT